VKDAECSDNPSDTAMEHKAESIYGVRECEMGAVRMDLDQGKAEQDVS